MNPQEHLLGKIARVFMMADEPMAHLIHLSLVPPHQGVEPTRLTSQTSGDELGIALVYAFRTPTPVACGAGLR